MGTLASRPIMTPDIQLLEDQLASVSSEAAAFPTHLTPEQGARRPAANSWSVAECLDHLAVTNRIYLRAMKTAAEQGRKQGKTRREPMRPGKIGGWIANAMEPPVKPARRMPAPKSSRPRISPPFADALNSFSVSQNELSDFLQKSADLDLNGILFVNPFLRMLRLSLTTGFTIILAHERRHLWQAKQAVDLVRSSLHS
jgi:hypothetical protein